MVPSTFKNKAVLVTGGAGFIGRHLVQKLSLLGARPHIVTRSLNSSQQAADLRKYGRVHIGSVSNRAFLKNVFNLSRPTFVFHLAADIRLERDFNFVPEMIQTNVLGTWNVLANCTSSVKRVVVVGTCEEYGNNPAPFFESMREKPVSPYSLSKVMSTYLSLMHYETTGFPVVIARPFLTYGPGQNNKMLIPSVIRSCLKGQSIQLTKGQQTRDFIYVDDVVDGLLKMMITKGIEGEIINLGSGHEARIRDVVFMIKKLIGSNSRLQFGALKYRAGETMHFFSRISKAQNILGWKPKISLREGLQKTISWFKSEYVQ